MEDTEQSELIDPIFLWELTQEVDTIGDMLSDLADNLDGITNPYATEAIREIRDMKKVLMAVREFVNQVRNDNQKAIEEYERRRNDG